MAASSTNCFLNKWGVFVHTLYKLCLKAMPLSINVLASSIIPRDIFYIIFVAQFILP